MNERNERAGTAQTFLAQSRGTVKVSRDELVAYCMPETLPGKRLNA